MNETVAVQPAHRCVVTSERVWRHRRRHQSAAWKQSQIPAKRPLLPPSVTSPIPIQFNPIQFNSIAFDVDGDSSTINRRFKSGGFVNTMASTSVLKLSCFVVWCQRDLQEKMETGSLIRNIKQSKFPMELIQLMTIIVMVVYTGKDGALLWWHWWTSSFRVETAAVDLHWPLIAELVTSRDLCSGVFSPFHSFPSSSPLTEQIAVLKCISNLSPESCTNHWRVYLTDTFHGLDSFFSLIACLMIKLVEAK